MQTLVKYFLFLMIILHLIGCASTYKGKVFQSSLIGGFIGGTYGASREEAKDKNALMYASIGALTGALLTAYLDDSDQKISDLESRNKKLNIEIEEIQNPRMVYQFPATFNGKIPEKYKKLINPGEWRVSEIDQWVEDDENKLIHQDKIMELTPPSLKPLSVPAITDNKN